MPQIRGKATQKHPQQWMLPLSALEQLCTLVNLFLAYSLTVGTPDACLPDFMASGVLVKLGPSEIEYNLGADVCVPIKEVAQYTLVENSKGLLDKIQANKRYVKRSADSKSTPYKGGPRKKTTATATAKSLFM